MVDVADSKSAGGDTVWVRVPPPAPLRNDLCMSDDRAGRAHLDSKGLSSFKPAIASLDCGFVLQIWQLMHSVHMAHRRRELCRFAAIFYAGKQSIIAFAEDTLEL